MLDSAIAVIVSLIINNAKYRVKTTSMYCGKGHNGKLGYVMPSKINQWWLNTVSKLGLIRRGELSTDTFSTKPAVR